MSDQQPQFELAKNIDHYLAALSKLYKQEGKLQKLEILVNSQVRVNGGWTYDNWDGGTYGHALFLAVPEAIYLNIVRQREVLQEQIKNDINSIHNVRGEYIEVVFLEMEAVADRDWRQKSGVLQLGRPEISSNESQRLWGGDGYRVFLSHKTEVKREAGALKERLQVYGALCFVAHEDIIPTKEWQEEIERALTSMDVLVALMTTGFHDSNWTDQEVGFALGRGVPVIAVKLGLDPYGFIGKFQALSCNWDAVPLELIRLLIKKPHILDAYIGSVERCSSFDHGNTLAKILPDIEKLTEDQVRRLIEAFKENSELRGSFGFNGSKPYYYGDGLVVHLSRITGHEYR